MSATCSCWFCACHVSFVVFQARKSGRRGAASAPVAYRIRASMPVRLRINQLNILPRRAERGQSVVNKRRCLSAMGLSRSYQEQLRCCREATRSFARWTTALNREPRRSRRNAKEGLKAESLSERNSFSRHQHRADANFRISLSFVSFVTFVVPDVDNRTRGMK